MRIAFIAGAFIAGAFAALSFSASANEEASAPETEPVYQGPVNVNLGGRDVTAEISLTTGDQAGDRAVDQADGQLDAGVGDLILKTDVSRFVDETEADLLAWLDAMSNRCGQRWRGEDPIIAFPGGDIRFSLFLDLEYWTCGFRGQAEPRRLAKETARIDVRLTPKVVDGALQAELKSFILSDQSGVNGYLPLEFIARQIIQRELSALNQNPKFRQPPNPLFDEGFAYKNLEADVTKITKNSESTEQVVITATFTGPNAPETHARIRKRLKSEGLTQ